MIVPNGKDRRSLRLFFEENEYMTNFEMAQLVNVNPRTIRRWRNKCGHKLHRPRHFYLNRKGIRPIELIHDQKVWDNREWFYEKYVKQDIGISILARMTGKDHHFIWKRLRRYDIQIKPRASNNPCCTRDWCVENYEIIGYTLRKCAEMAGVNPYTFMDWLVHFGIHIRDRLEALSGERNPLYGKPITPFKAQQKATA
jgi:hypothetical protein